jgi:hypothetical protein
MVRYLIWAMEGRGKMSMLAIYRAVQQQCARFGRTLPGHWEAEVRQTLQAHCASRPQYKGHGDFFTWHHRGVWSCKIVSPSLDDLLVGPSDKPGAAA